MNIHFNIFQVSSPYSCFKEKVFSSLTLQQKKVLTVAAIAFGCLAICYAVARLCCFKVEALIDKQDLDDQEHMIYHQDRQENDIDTIQLNFHDNEIIEEYFKHFESLAKSEKWSHILSQGILALEAAQKTHQKQNEAKICAQLTSTSFYLGDYKQALIYANHCHGLAEAFEEPHLFIRALYLESAVFRALAPTSENEQDYYLQAVKIAEQAITLYTKKDIDDSSIKGKVYFNLGAAHADNPKGDLNKAVDCYLAALECFKKINATDDLIRTHLRLGKVYLLLKNYDHAQKIVNESRLSLASERLAMHADYLEAQIKFALNDFQLAIEIAKKGLTRAKHLGAKEDEARLIFLIDKVEKAQE